MKTNSFLLKKFCFVFFLIICFTTYAGAQQKVPKNYIAASGIIELNRLAVGGGVEYERWIYTRNQWAFGTKGHYIFPSKTINSIFSTGDSFERNRQIQIMATSYLFTNPEKEIKGLFFSFGAGINLIKWETDAYDASGNRYITSVSEVSPGFDFSLGAQFELSNRSALRFTGGYETFIGKKYYNEFVSGHGVALLYIKVSVGL